MTRHRIAVMLFVLLGLSMSVVAQKPMPEKKVLVSGTVVGFNGKPVAKAHAHFERMPQGSTPFHLYTVSVAANGSYMMKLPTGMYRVAFTGVNHQRTGFVQVNIQEDGENILHARLPLSPFFPAEKMDSVHLSYIDYRTLREVDTLMEKVAPGLFELRVSVLPLNGTFTYHVSNTMPDRRVNGTLSEFYRYDGDGDYLSGITFPSSKDTTITIRFDASLLPQAGEKFPQAYEDSVWGPILEYGYTKLLRELKEIKDSTHSIRSFRTPQASVEGMDDTAVAYTSYSYYVWRGDTVRRYDTIHVWEIRKVERMLLDAEHTARIRLAAAEGPAYLQSYLPYLQLLSGLNRWELTAGQKELAREAFKEIPASSDLWKLSSSYQVSRHVLEDSLSYLLRIAAESPHDDIVLDVCTSLLSRLRFDTEFGGRQGVDTLRALQLLDSLRDAALLRLPADAAHARIILAADGERAANDFALAYLKKNLEKETRLLKWFPADTLSGQRVPDFHFPDLVHPGKLISNSSVAGNPYIMILWDVGSCGLTEFLSIYDDLYRTYHDHGLEIINIISSKTRENAEGNLQTLAELGYSPPWHNGYLDSGTDTALLRWRVHPLRPLVLFVDSEGSVVASGDRMQGAYALVTVAAFFELQER